VQTGFYKELVQKTALWIDCISAGLYGVCRQGSDLRIELVVPYEHLALSPIEYLAIRNILRDFLSNGRTLVTPASKIPYDEVIEPALELLRNLDIRDFKQIVAAESFIGLLLDGGPLRVYYPGLQSALGQTIGQALANAQGGIISPASLYFSHVTWDAIDLDRLAIPIAFFFRLHPTIPHHNGLKT